MKGKLGILVMGGICVTAFSVSLAWAHGGGGSATGGLGCTYHQDGQEIHVSAYQPQHLSQERRGLRMLEEYCKDIPKVGKTILSFNFVSHELREMPLSVRIVEAADSQVTEPRTISSLPSKAYPTGVISTEVNFDKPGRYVALISHTHEKGGEVHAVSHSHQSDGGAPPIHDHGAMGTIDIFTGRFKATVHANEPETSNGPAPHVYHVSIPFRVGAKNLNPIKGMEQWILASLLIGGGIYLVTRWQKKGR